ncbi:MAG: NAD(P)/FAD-dependent oxidoreductase [Chloroflexi bacterium]|nr:NAD(P)/FAD-dependent oxidoreductase [Chloroflexota bacterium]
MRHRTCVRRPRRIAQACLVFLAVDLPRNPRPEITMPERLDFDAAIVGGGPAGLAAAVNLARALRSVLVFDRPQPGRSDYPQVNHNYLGFPEGMPARELCERGTAQAKRYGARFCDSEVVAIQRVPGGFMLEGSGGEGCRARGVLLATGVRDNWTRFPGFEAFVGRSLHWCIVCDGYEMQGKRVVVAGNDDEAATTALQMHRFTPDVTLVTNDGALGLTPEAADQLARRQIPLVIGRIDHGRARDGEPGMLASLRLEDGRELPAEHLFSHQGATPQTALARSLGLELSGGGYIKGDIEQRTSEPFVYAAGDCTRLFAHQIVTAAHEGATAAQTLNYDLFQADEAHAATGARDA